MNDFSGELIDSSLFLGMHSVDEEVRISCKNYFVERLPTKVSMSLEHIGGCDNIIWMYPTELQDLYYPFMDNLHTIMKMDRVPYQEPDIAMALSDPRLRDILMYDRLLMALAKNHNQLVFTINKQLLSQGHLPVACPPLNSEKKFPDSLEVLYQTSLALKISDNLLTSR